MYFFTFCNFINRISQRNLEDALFMLLSSMEKCLPEYNLLCFINYELDFKRFEKFNIEFRNYYDDGSLSVYRNDPDGTTWKNMSFNKLNIFKDIYNETGKDYIWVDLDTIIAFDISYINELTNIFIPNGGTCENNNKIFINTGNNYVIPRKNNLQGNFWKINIDIYNDLMDTFKEIKEKGYILQYDAQSLFNYHIYFKNKMCINNFNILGLNYKKEIISGLTMWSKEGNTHATINGLLNLYVKDSILKSIFYPEKEIHIVSFTFFTLNQIINSDLFKEKFKNLLS